MTVAAENISPYSHRILTLISSIPFGRVTTYGLIAEAAGNGRGARQVARLLHSCSGKYRLPWHRVVNKEGRIVLSAGEQMQRRLLAKEGIVLDHRGRVPLDRYLWLPIAVGDSLRDQNFHPQ